jgi:hypothetical protein
MLFGVFRVESHFHDRISFAIQSYIAFASKDWQLCWARLQMQGSSRLLVA